MAGSVLEQRVVELETGPGRVSRGGKDGRPRTPPLSGSFGRRF